MPQAARSDADDAIFLSSAYGLTPHVWQANVLRAWLGVRKDGQWSASTCGLAVPRQNGKNALIEMRELFGMVALGEKFLHTAHQVKTARKAFLRIASFFENERQYPELASMVKEIRKTNGQEAVVLDNGGQVEFVARSKGSARGFTVDILVCDEAQDLTDEELAALLPTTAAAPLGNPQLIVTGTPPDPDKGETGEVFTRIRAQATEAKSKRVCWIDYGSDGPMPDVDDRRLWLARNPSCGLPHGTTIEALADFHAVMAPQNFAREFLCWWGDPADKLSGAFSPGAWGACRDDRIDPATGWPISQIASTPSVAIDVSPDRANASIGVAGLRSDGLRHVELIDHDRDRPGVKLRGTGWVPARVREVVEASGAPGVIVDPGSAAGALIPTLRDEGLEVIEVSGREYVQACGAIYDAVEDAKVRHLAQPDLDAAVMAAKQRPTGDAWKWDRRDITADITPLVAVTLALAGVGDSGDVSVFFFDDLDEG